MIKKTLRWLAAPALALALVCVSDSPKADAGGFSLQIGGLGVSNYSSGFRGGPVGFGPRGFGPSIGVGPSYGYGYNSFYRSARPVAVPRSYYYGPRSVPRGVQYNYYSPRRYNYCR